MPRSKNPDSYPTAFSRLLAGAFASRTTVTIPVSDKNAGTNMRHMLYAYINALDSREEHQRLPFELRQSPEFRQVKITILDGPPRLELINKNLTDEMLALTKIADNLPQPSEERNAKLRERALEQLAEGEAATAANARDQEPPDPLESLYK